MQSCTSTTRVSSSRLFIISCISLCLLVSIDSIASSDDLIKSMCSKTRYSPTDCETVVREDPRSKNATKAIEVANIIIDLAIANATKCVESFTHLQNLSTTPPAWKPALKACAEEFSYSAREFLMAKEDLTADPKLASYNAFVAGDGAQMCDSTLKNHHVNIPQLTAYGNNLMFFAITANDMFDFV